MKAKIKIKESKEQEVFCLKESFENDETKGTKIRIYFFLRILLCPV